MNTASLASLFKSLSEPVRLRILNLLISKGDICVCDLVRRKWVRVNVSNLSSKSLIILFNGLKVSGILRMFFNNRR